MVSARRWSKEIGMERRKLVALEPDDLAIISAHVQDAAVHPRDILWRPSEKRLVVGLRRLDWDRVLQGADECHRVPQAAPSGIVRLIFSGDATLRITVECLECELADLAAPSKGSDAQG
jgi:hypothetical protein